MPERQPIVIPAGRGAKHKARRLARANRMTSVRVVDRKGRVHYSAWFHGLDTMETWTCHWERGLPWNHFLRRDVCPGPLDVARMRDVQAIEAMYRPTTS